MRCFEDVEKCRFRIFDLEKDISFCNFCKENAKLIVDRQFARIPALVSKACDYIKKEELRLKSLVEVSRKKTLDFIKNAQVGEIVFCRIKNPPEVKLLEKPINDSKFVSCQKSNGSIIRVQACHLYRISKGHYYGDYLIEGFEKKSEKRAKDLEFQAKYYGLRAEIKKNKKGYLLKIFGDSQQEVDDFIYFFIKQNFELIF